MNVKLKFQKLFMFIGYFAVAQFAFIWLGKLWGKVNKFIELKLIKKVLENAL